MLATFYVKKNLWQSRTFSMILLSLYMGKMTGGLEIAVEKQTTDLKKKKRIFYRPKCI